MEKGFLDKVEDNAVVRACVTHNNLQELKEIWDQWNEEVKQLFYSNYGDLPYLLDMKKSLKDIILAHPYVKKRVDIFPLSIYDLVIFPKALGHIDEVVTDLFDRLDKMVTLVPAILAETFRSLNACRRAGEGRFVGCAQLLLAWFHSYFWRVDKDLYRNLREEDIKWRAPWLLPNEILYRRDDFDLVPLLGIWGAIGYAPDGYKKKIREMTNAWNQTQQMKRLAVGPMKTPEHNEWWVRRINDNIPELSHGNIQSIEEHFRVVPSELEIIKQDFERRNAELENRIEQMEEENMNLRLDAMFRNSRQKD
ncbi:hypothetical protein Golax_022947 [Gossypium laxum]|uniref:DUF7745 domain-containing protein n=1 Tax=Gossypium laxum TaxID=34288 RepID=A0A7J9B4W6_9ROSI|nr:hypothetical protein [Gossypium laxum]